MKAIPDYLVIGHVTRDVVSKGESTTGGTATFAALTAARLGLQVGVLTSSRGAVAALAQTAAITVCRKPASATTTFENTYDGGRRRQSLRSRAHTLTIADVPSDWGRAPIVHLGPVAQEVDEHLITAFPQALVGITPQGWLRSWGADGFVRPVAWNAARQLLPSADVVILSLEDLGGDRQELEVYQQASRVLVLTAGQRGACVYCQGRADWFPAFEAVEVDSTGAGDVFAAAFLVHFAENGDARGAARFANCAASFVVEGVGTTTVPHREQVEWRLRHGKVRTVGGLG